MIFMFYKQQGLFHENMQNAIRDDRQKVAQEVHTPTAQYVLAAFGYV